jgi:hypothetical protein
VKERNMAAVFRSELRRPATTVLTVIAGTLLLLGSIIVSRHSRERPENNRRVNEPTPTPAGDKLGLCETVAVAPAHSPSVINAVEKQGREPHEVFQPVTPKRELAVEQDSEWAAQEQPNGRRAVSTQALQDTSRSWFALSQRQWQRNLEGFNRLTCSQSVQEFTSIQSELARDGVQLMIDNSRLAIETSMRAVDEVGRAFSPLPQGSRSNLHEGI